VARRRLMGATLGMFGAGYVGAIGYPMYRYVRTPVERAALAAQVTEVTPQGAKDIPVGQAMGFMFGTRPAVLIHRGDHEWAAFDAVCTHLGCTVKYEPDKDRIFCECHLGTYDARTGEPTSGPPPRALTKYVVEEKDGVIVVARQ
jgi:cytochrome b6-f complex iron-sulfur subunit